jgi:predicted nucleic acid-binding protein
LSVRKVLDSFAVIAFLDDEPGAERVGDLIRQARDAERSLLLSVVNWGEVYYILRRASGEDAADKAIQMLETLPIEVAEVDRLITKIAAELKSQYRLSYADCFAAALAIHYKAELVTGDQEFRAIEGKLRGIQWIASGAGEAR